MRCRLLSMLLILTASGMAFGQAPALQPSAPQPQPPATASPLPTGPMRFSWVREGPADKCADKCREWISAAGEITPDTPRRIHGSVRPVGTAEPKCG